MTGGAGPPYPQRDNLSRRCGVEFDDEAPIVTMSEVLKDGPSGVGQDVVVPIQWTSEEAEYIDLLPSRFDLLNRETEAGIVGAVPGLFRRTHPMASQSRSRRTPRPYLSS